MSAALDEGEPTPPWLSSVTARLPEGLAVLDDDDVLRYANPAAARLLGAPEAPVVGRSLHDVLPGLSSSSLHRFLRHARSAGGPVRWRGPHPNGGPPLAVTAELIDGRLAVRLRILRDLDLESYRLSFLAEVFEVLTTTLDADEAIEQLARLVVPRLADWSTVTLLGEDGAPDRTTWAHRDPSRLVDIDTFLTERNPDPRAEQAIQDALFAGEPVQLTSIPEGLGVATTPEGPAREAFRRLGPASALFVPLKAREQTFGVLTLINCGDRRPHSEDDIATAVEIARRAALAVDNARLYGRQMEVAETLQHSLLTPPPQVPGLQIAVRYRPASSHALVGGDWYDAFQKDDGATLLVIGDVVGHNVQAASTMAQLRSAVRTLAYDRPDSPGRTLDRVDRVLRGLHVGALATALVARLDPPARDGSRTLRWSSAGHLPPLLLHADGQVRLLDRRPERLLGTDEPATHTDAQVTVRPGDTLVLVTDGLVEVGRTGIDHGLARLMTALADLAGLAADPLCDRLLDQLVPDRADDDVAVLAVRCLPPAAPPPSPPRRSAPVSR